MMRWFRRQGNFSGAAMALAALWLLAAQALALASAVATREAAAGVRAVEGVVLDRCALGDEQRRRAHECPIDCPSCPASGPGAAASVALLADAVAYPPPATPGPNAAPIPARAAGRWPARVNLGSPRAPPRLS